MATVAQHLKNIATSLRARLDSINASLTAKGQTAADTYDDVPALIDAISTGSNVAGVTATADKVLDGSVFVDSTGAEVEGTMPNNGAIEETMDGIDTKSISIPKGYTSGGTVSLTDDIENIADEQADLISQIQTALEGKAAGGGGITPSGTIEITENGTHDVTNYASALVNVASSGGGSSVVRSTTGIPIAHDVTAKTITITGVETSGLTHLFLDLFYPPFGVYMNGEATTSKLYLANIDLDIANGVVDWTVISHYANPSSSSYTTQAAYSRNVNATITVDQANDTITVDYSAVATTFAGAYPASGSPWYYTAIYES